MQLMTQMVHKVLAVMILGSCLSGCQILHPFSARSCANDSTGYAQAGSIPPLKVPVGTDPPDTRSSLAIPVLNEPTPPARGPKEPCLEEPPLYSDPKGPKPVPAA